MTEDPWRQGKVTSKMGHFHMKIEFSHISLEDVDIEEAVIDENDDFIDLEHDDILETEEETLEGSERSVPVDIPKRIEYGGVNFRLRPLLGTYTNY